MCSPLSPVIPFCTLTTEAASFRPERTRGGRGEGGVTLATGSRWRPASPLGLTGAQGSGPSKLGALGGVAATAQPEHPALPFPPRRKNRPICHDPTEILLFPAPSPRSSPSRGGRRRCGAGERKAQAWGGGGMRGQEPGGFPPVLPPPTGAENVICCAFQARFPGVTSPSRPGRGEQTKRRGRRRGDPAGR